MLRREALPLYGRQLADALVRPGDGAFVTLWPLRGSDAGAEEIEIEWDAFFDVLRTRRPFRGVAHHPGWSSATFSPSVRAMANVRSVSAVVQVLPRAARVSLDAFVDAWQDRFGVVFTTNEHSQTANAFVAVFPYTRPVSLAEHHVATGALVERAKREGLPFDLGARNPARFVYLPGAVPGEPFETRMLVGRPINPR